mmetsp:Transcript_21841/g.40736  ORF Transcript_21841/g.40736 Transcript_21841/m.40736 type:complete len:781 (+) Transcript_21841:66-2408(+)|eukprot:CAMPEP_0114432164 /NCGR_PEP_ID=MMETSP0103-20121206/11007_1 /TAXON_ID=37642 ORGANISM="Paraphysomonas imperforata, Strain PA2" /NCGR_SAMPLE_ID=MMETSP0103 /ASSEMBLY_ACC=CAM_ASM_000201 /LENGTH=780 /DNA_ID=CAMNT_0001601817 /DNA_START=58 /DNA_END=2400 /DNA_ORIENTATION=-
MNLSGPQSSRDKSWVRKPAEISGDREDLVIDRNAEKQVYEGELGRVRRENASLRDQLQRTLRELKAFQLKYPDDLMHRQEDDEDLPPWATSAEKMTPLLLNYDSRVLELEAQVKQQSVQLEQFHSKVEEILTENDDLRERLLAATSTDANLDPMAPLNTELVKELKSKEDILMRENSLLVEQTSVMAAELEENGALLEERSNQIVELCSRVTELTESNKQLNDEVQQACSDRQESAEQLLKGNESLGRLQVQVEELGEELGVWEQRCYKAEKAVSATETELKAEVAAHSQEAHTSMQRLKAAEERVKELHALLLQKTHDLDVAQDVARKLRREYQSTRQDAEGMLQVMAGLERQLSEYSSREAEVEKLSKENKEKTEEALVMRDQAMTREEQLRREVDRLYDEKKKLVLTKHNDIESAVHTAKEVAASQMKSLEADLQEMVARNARLKAEEERALRECKSAHSLLEKSRHSHEGDSRSAELAMSRLEEKIREVVKEREEAIVKSKEVNELNTELRLLIDKLRSQEESLRLSMDEKDSSRRKEAESLRGQVRDLQRDLAAMQRSGHKSRKEVDELTRGEEAKLLAMQKQHDEELALHRRRAQEAEQGMKEMELTGVSEEHRVRLLLEQYKEKSSLSTMKLEAQLAECRESIVRLHANKKGSEMDLQNAEAEKKRLVNLLQESKIEIVQLHECVADYKNENADLASQLTLSLEAREAAAKQKARASKFLYDDEEGELLDEDFDYDDHVNKDGQDPAYQDENAFDENARDSASRGHARSDDMY